MIGIRNILVPLDGSRFAEAALPVARRLCHAASAQLQVLLVHESRLALVAAGDMPVGDLSEYDNARKHQEQEYLAEVSSGTPGSTFALVEGRPGPALVEHIEGSAPDLVVMSTHGRGPLSRVWLGSVTDYVVRHVHVPVLLLRPKDGSTIPSEPPEFRRGLVLLDQSQEAEALLRPLTEFARLNHSHLTLMHVVTSFPIAASAGMPAYVHPLPAEMTEAMRADAQRYLDGVADRLRAGGLRVAATVETGLDVAWTVLERLEGGDYDFVALTTHGAGGLQRLLVGSVADKVIRGAHRPVLVVRPVET